MPDQAANRSVEAKRQYESRLREQLETSHHGQFVAIDSESGEHFIGGSFVDAAMQARSRYPDRLPFVIRIGYPTANHIGAAV